MGPSRMMCRPSYGNDGLLKVILLEARSVQLCARAGATQPVRVIARERPAGCGGGTQASVNATRVHPRSVKLAEDAINNLESQ